jgi:hypothetical protein
MFVRFLSRYLLTTTSQLIFFVRWWDERDCGSKDDCGGADFELSGVVDRLDLKIFCD